MVMIKRNDNCDACNECIDECGIKDPKLLTEVQRRAKKKTRIILNYLDLPDVHNREENSQFVRKREALAEDLYGAFYQQEEIQVAGVALTCTVFIMSILFLVIYLNLPCPVPSPYIPATRFCPDGCFF